jgi:hypothetical protein
MQKCLNCDSQITCGCQRRHATNGKLVCTKCLADYEKTLQELKQTTSSLDEQKKESEDNKNNT